MQPMWSEIQDLRSSDGEMGRPLDSFVGLEEAGSNKSVSPGGFGIVIFNRV